MRNLSEYRRDTAKKDLESTHVKQNVCIVSLVIFSMILLSVPICQFTSEILKRKFPQVFQVGELVSNPRREAFEKYENTLEEEAILTNWLLPNVQTTLTSLFNIGNEQVYIGGGGWLFYRADIDSVIGISDNPAQRKYDDALSAILDFNQQLEARNITLIVVPIPVKPTIYPEQFSTRYTKVITPLHNPSYTKLVETLVSQGVIVYDPSSLLYEGKRQNSQYLKTDTHWKPEAMERVAKDLASFINERIEFVNAPTTTYTKAKVENENIGDIAKMLKLPENQNLFQPERITSNIIMDHSGELWQPDRNAEILFLGDSFSNIYSFAGMGWGESAGFAEHLSAELSRPVDTIIINDGGAFATRQKLIQKPERLNGKRVLIYQFAARELYSGDWKILSIPESQSTLTNDIVSPEQSTKGITITASVIDKTEPPTPGSVPYSECIIAFHLGNIKTPDLPEEIVVFMWGMRDNKWTDATKIRVGKNIKLHLQTWDSVEADYGSYNRIELENEETWVLDIYWGEMP